LKDELIIQNIKDFKYKHLSEVSNIINYLNSWQIKYLEEDYSNEIANFNEEWANKLSEFNENSKKVTDQLNERQEREMQRLIEHLDDQLPKTVKFSSTYLKNKDQEKKLVKMEKYDKIHRSLAF